MTAKINITEQTTTQEIKGFIDELTYSCYKYNRERSPDITPERWGCVFSNINLLELRYQYEIKGNN
jgi:hypothetical protein